MVQRLLFLGLSQYGLLHFGQIIGFSFFFLGTHSCSHLSHLKPLILIVISAITKIRVKQYINLTFSGIT